MQKMSFRHLVLPGVLLAWLPAIAGAQTLLVVNQGDVNVSLVDPVAGREVAKVAQQTGGDHGHEVAASGDGRLAFVPIYGSTGLGLPGTDGREMLVIDVASREIVGHIDFGRGVRPHFAVLDPVSGLLYVTTELDQTVTVVDPKTRKIVGTVPTGQADSHMMALSHDGRRGYTANVRPGTVSVLDLVGRKTVAVIPVAGSVQRIAISADDKLVFTADQTKPQMAVIDTATNEVKTWVALPGLGYGAAATADGKWLLVGVPSKELVAVVDLASMQVVRSVAIGTRPQEILIRPDGKVAYVSCPRSGQVAAVDLAAWKVEKLIDVGKGADGLGWARSR